MFDYLSEPRITGTEHIEYAPTFEKVQVGIWCIPPKLYDEDVLQLLLPKDLPRALAPDPQDE